METGEGECLGGQLRYGNEAKVSFDGGPHVTGVDRHRHRLLCETDEMILGSYFDHFSAEHYPGADRPGSGGSRAKGLPEELFLKPGGLFPGEVESMLG